MIRKATERFHETELDDGLVIMDVDTGEFHTLQNTGLAIWKLIDGTRGEAEIVDALTAQYEVDREVCAREIAAFIDEVVGAGFVARD
jgi:hypothetical protein